MPPGCPILDFTIPNFFPTFPRSEKNPYMSPSETAAASKLSKKSLSGLSEVSEMEDGSSIVSCLELSNIDESLNDTVVTDINTKDISTSEINRENKKNPIPSLQLKKSTQMPSSVLSDTSSVHRSNHVGAGDSPLTSILKGSPNHNFSGTASPRTIGMKSEGGSIEKGDRNSSSYKSNVDPDCSEFRMKYVQITGDRSPTSCQSIDTDKSRCEKAITLLNDEVKKNKKYHDEENWGGNFVSGKRGFNVSDNECKHTEMKERMTDTS